MHLRFALVPLLLTAALDRTGAQCSPATQRLIGDLKYDEARAQAQSAVQQNGANDIALHCMGMIYMAMDKPGDAADWFEKATKANDRVSAHHLWLANALGSQAPHTNKLKLPFLARRVKSEFDKAAQLDPTSIDARHGLIQFYSQAPGVMGGSMDKAKEQARAIGEINKMRGHLEMASLLQHEKDMPGTERELAASVAAAPDSAVASYTMANFYVSEKRWPEAFAIYERIMKEMPSELGAHLQYGRAAALSGTNLDRGERELKYFLANEPKDLAIGTRSTAHVRLGAIYEKQGKKDAARAEYQLAVTINPKNAEAKRALDTLN